MFADKKSGLTGYLNMGGVKGKVGDYFSACIKNERGELVVKDMNGTYMGYVDIDGERWFDRREQ